MESPGMLERIGGRIGNPLEWNTPARCLVLALLTVPYPFLNVVETRAVRADPSLAPFLNQDFLPAFERSQLLFGYLWLAIVGVCLLGLWRGVKEDFALAAFCSLVFGVGQGIIIYMMGSLTTPAMMTFIGSTLGAGLWLGLRAGLIGAIGAAAVVFVTTAAERAGALAYGPLVAAAPFQAGRLHPWWLRVVGLSTLGYTVASLALIAVVLVLWRRRERELRAANALLRRGAGIKDEFVATVSHELRTPLTSVLGALRLLESRVRQETPEESRQILAIAARNTDRLVRLVHDLLDIRTLTTGVLSRTLVPTDLAALGGEVCDELRLVAGGSGVTIDYECALSASAYLADPDRMAQVLWNLLDNAVKHSPQGGTVRLCLRAEAGRVALRVEDEGPGLPAGAPANLFEPFHHAGATNAARGSGLGLAIVRAIAESHGGNVRAENRECGGARFTVSLPLEAAGD